MGTLSLDSLIAGLVWWLPLVIHSIARAVA